MPERILVVEYEPRYTERVRQALSGQSYEAVFAKDGEEALVALSQSGPQLIVLSSIIPKISTSELIRRVRANVQFQNTPILITVSGYNGKNPKSDAIRLGANDILPKPYSEGEFLNKIKHLAATASEPDASQAQTVQMPMIKPGAAATGKLTSDDIFGELVDDGAAKKKPARAADSNIDELLSKTLSGLQGGAKKSAEATPAPSSSQPAAPAPTPAAVAAATKSADVKKRDAAALDKLLENTLSGLERSKPRPVADPPQAPRPAAAPAPAAPPPVVAKSTVAMPLPAPAAPLPPP
ncbi:MAG: response regulator, partial [Thermoanaerobaculia bacterium]